MSFLGNVCNDYFSSDTCSRIDPILSIMGQLAIGVITTPLQTIIHESGHAIAACFLHEGANPKIELDGYGYRGGSCSYNSNILSKAGRLLGRNNAYALVHAAGPVTDMITSLALLYFYPGNGYSFIKLFDNTCYALSTIMKNPIPDHDFVNVKRFGGNLAAGSLVITSIALSIFGLYSLLYERYSNGTDKRIIIITSLALGNIFCYSTVKFS